MRKLQEWKEVTEAYEQKGRKGKLNKERTEDKEAKRIKITTNPMKDFRQQQYEFTLKHKIKVVNGISKH